MRGVVVFVSCGIHGNFPRLHHWVSCGWKPPKYENPKKGKPFEIAGWINTTSWWPYLEMGPIWFVFLQKNNFKFHETNLFWYFGNLAGLHLFYLYIIRPGKLTWNLKMDLSNRRFLLETTIFRFYVKFRVSIYYIHIYHNIRRLFFQKSRFFLTFYLNQKPGHFVWSPWGCFLPLDVVLHQGQRLAFGKTSPSDAPWLRGAGAGRPRKEKHGYGSRGLPYAPTLSIHT